MGQCCDHTCNGHEDFTQENGTQLLQCDASLLLHHDIFELFAWQLNDTTDHQVHTTGGHEDHEDSTAVFSS